MAATSLKQDKKPGYGENVNSPVDRATLLQAFNATRARSCELARPLSAEDQQVQSMDDASPSKWHLGHVTWFFENFLLSPLMPAYRPFHPKFGYIFNSYYEAVGPRHARPRRGQLTRPRLAKVHAYRAHVEAAMEKLVEVTDDADWDRVAALITLGINHEQQHQELLLTDIKHAFGGQPLAPAYQKDLPNPGAEDSQEAAPARFIAVEGGEYEVGNDGETFVFDNETPAHRVRIEDFALAERPITNGEFLDFMEAGGYETATWWLADGWSWVQDGASNLTAERAPLYWRRHDGGWWEYTLGGERPLDLSAPASHLTYYEADAYARFAGKRLPTEAEWETAARGLGTDAEEGANLLVAGLMHPVTQATENQGFSGLFGDIWEWTSSAYGPYPGFRPTGGAVGEYNGKFMVNQLVLKGGSCVTPPGHIRASYRNFFYPHQNWQFTGARLADDL